MRIVLFMVSLVLSGQTFAADTVKPPPTNKQLAAENGRFVFGQISDYRRDQYLLDTKTGRMWRVVTYKFKNEDGTDAPGEGYEAMTPVWFKEIGRAHV